MAHKERFDFTKKDRRTNKVEKVGHLDFSGDEREGKCSLYFYGDIVSATWQSMMYEEDKCPQDISDFLGQLDGYEEIDIYINSGGGDVFAGLAIHNQLKRHSGHKVGHVDGMAASIASVIMFACDELHFATGAQAMIHKPLCLTIGNADDHRESIKCLDLCEESILDIYGEHLKEGVTREKIKALMAAETWFSGTELAEYFDIEVEGRAAAAICTSDYFGRYRNAPEGLGGHGAEGIAGAATGEAGSHGAKCAGEEMQELLGDLDLYGI